MRKLAKLPIKERGEVFQQTSSKIGLSNAIVEKDFWVCWALDYLFSRCSNKTSFAFKGGTSLSKSFGIIERFSEDIDLIIDWRTLGYGIDEPWEKRSNTKQDIFVEKINDDAASFLESVLMPQIVADFSQEITDKFNIFIDKEDPQTLCFAYPSTFQDDSILQEIRLETGALAAWTPTQAVNIKPYVAEQFPDSFSVPFACVRTVSPERTFWEKATILHKEAFRTNGLPDRYSRHYYDIHRLCGSEVKDRALADLELLSEVVRFKMQFWRSNVARYDLCKPGTFKLMPPKEQLELVKSDYGRMQNMLFGSAPTFDQMMESIAILEEEINSLFSI